MGYFERALELRDEIVAHRRYLHQNAEVGLELPKAVDYVMKQLTDMGIHAEKCGHGVVATIGNGGKVILLRADMDALPLKEESGETFASTSDSAAHCCGHDMHTAMLLGAAKMLKENEAELKGTVKLMFQPGEEIFKGAKDMIEAGVLENPTVDAALSYHVGPGRMPVGLYMYNNEDTMMFSNDGFKISVQGKGGHGSYPQLAIDAVSIAAHIVIGLQEIIAREVDPNLPCIMTIGKLIADGAYNTFPDTAEIQGTIRTNSKEEREKMVNRMKEVATSIAATYRGSAKIEMINECPPLICNKEFTNEIIGYMSELNIPGQMGYPGIRAQASDDFATILDRVPGVYMFVSSGYVDRDVAPSHNPKVVFNEDVLPNGAAYYAHCATRYLENH